MPSVCQREATPTEVGVTFLMLCHHQGGLNSTSPAVGEGVREGGRDSENEIIESGLDFGDMEKEQDMVDSWITMILLNV